MKFFLGCAFFFFPQHANAFAHLPITLGCFSGLSIPSASCEFQKAKLSRKHSLPCPVHPLRCHSNWLCMSFV